MSVANGVPASRCFWVILRNSKPERVWTDTTADYLTGILVPGAVIGVAAGCSFAMLVGATMRDVPPRQFGMGGAGRATIFQLSIAIGVAVAITLIGRPSSPADFLDSIRTVWLLGVVLLLGQAALFAFAYPRRQHT